MQLLQNGKQQFIDQNGAPLAGGLVYHYAPGTTNPVTTYKDSGGSAANTNPVNLDARGQAVIWGLGTFRQVVTDASGNLIWDQVVNAPDVNAASSALQALLAARSGSALIGFQPPGIGAVVRNAEDKMHEFPSFADKGASDTGDALAAVQNALNMGYGALGDSSYSVSAAIRIPSLSHFRGARAGTAFIGNTPTVKRAIKKTTNAAAAIKNFQSNVTSNIDCIAYTDPAWIDGGAAYPQKAVIEGIAFQGLPASPNATGLYIEQGGGWTLRDLDFSHVVNAIYAKEAWLTTVERVHAMGKIVWAGGTSVTFTNCWTGAGPGSSGGYSFASLLYSVMNACGSDGATDTAYRFVNSKMTLNSCGCEGASASTANSGTAIALDGGNEIVFNNFNAIPAANQVTALMSCGSDNTATFNQGCSSFGVAGVNCPDMYVWGNNSTVIFNDYTFLNGSKNNPVVQFAAGVSTSRMIVRFGDNWKIYTSSGNGVTVIDAFRDAGTWTPVLTFGGVAAPATIQTGSWQKHGGIITCPFRLQLSGLGAGNGVAILGGWPAFFPVGDMVIDFALVESITGGPIIGTIDIGGNQAVLSARTATGDNSITQANFTAGSLLRGTITIVTTEPTQ